MLWWNHIAALLTSLPNWVYFCSDTDFAGRAIDRYMPNSFQVVPRARSTIGSQAKDPLAVWGTHSGDSGNRAWCHDLPVGWARWQHSAPGLYDCIKQSSQGGFQGKRSHTENPGGDELGEQQFFLFYLAFGDFGLCADVVNKPRQLYLLLHLCS